MMKRGLLAASVIFTTSAIAHPAEFDSSARTEQVSYADLDLSAMTGQMTLENRIHQAADRVCDLGGMQTLDDFSTSLRCFQRAVKDAQAKVNQLLAGDPSAHSMAAALSIISVK